MKKAKPKPLGGSSESGGATVKDTVFVRNIADGVNVAELNEVFGDIGPVKHCFIVVEKEGPNKGKSKHFGFVQFALEEDASAAISQLQRKIIGGKPLILEAAAKRGYRAPAEKIKANRTESRKRQRGGSIRREDSIFAKLSKRAQVLGLSDAKKQKKVEAEDERKKEELLRDCSVLLFGVPRTMTRGQLKKKLSKVGKINTIEYPLESLQVGQREEAPVCLCIYTKQTSAAQAVKRLSKKVWDNSTVQARRIKQVAVAHKSRTRCRLIVRNLPFKLKKEDLKARFEQFGPVLEVTLDLDASGKRHKGFGFVQFACKADAQNAVKGTNGQRLKNRPIAVDFAVASKVYKKLLKNEREEVEATAIGEDVEMVDEGNKGGKQPDEGDETGDDSGKDEEDESEKGEDSDDEQPEDEEETDAEDIEREKEAKKADELKRTLFIRNLHFDTPESDVLEKFKEFGAVRYVKLVKDKQGKSRGTAFVQFFKKQGYDRALMASQSGGTLTAREIRLKQKLKPSERKIAALNGGNGIMLQGRPIVVKPAVDRSEAKALQEQGRHADKTDRRHLYLAREGLIQANDEKTLNLPKDDLNKRQSAEREKKAKLKSPLFFVSPTRLSVRNLNRREKDESGNFVDDGVLRKAFRKAAILGMQNRVVGANEGDPNLFPATWPDQKKVPPVIVSQARVLYEDPPLGSTAKKGRSKGFGFVEFTQHVHALACLRIVNNNPDYAYLASAGQSAMSRPVHQRPRLIVEFSVENAAKLRERQKKVDMARRRNELNLRRARLQGTLPAKETGKDKADAAKSKEPNNSKGSKPRRKNKQGRPDKATETTKPMGASSSNFTEQPSKGKHKRKLSKPSPNDRDSNRPFSLVNKPKRKTGAETTKSVNRESVEVPQKTRKRKKKAGGSAPADSFESMLTKYTSAFVPTAEAAKKTSRWFD